MAKGRDGSGTDDEAEMADWQSYWDSLTPDERKQELQAMADYAAEADY